MKAFYKILKQSTWVPLALGLMIFPSLIFNVALDNAGSDYYGFPLPWNSRGLVSSLTKDIYLLPLCVDLLFYGALSFIIFRYWQKRSSKPVIRKALYGMVWFYGLAAFLYIMLVVNIYDMFFYFWYDHSFKIISFKLGLGI